MRFAVAALVAAFFSCATPVADEKQQQCAQVVAKWESEHKAAGNLWRGVVGVARGTVMGAFTHPKTMTTYLLLLAAPGALVPSPEDTDFTFVGHCVSGAARMRVYAGVVHPSGERAQSH